MNSKRFKVVSPRLLYVLDLFKYTSHTVVGGGWGGWKGYKCLSQLLWGGLYPARWCQVVSGLSLVVVIPISDRVWDSSVFHMQAVQIVNFKVYFVRMKIHYKHGFQQFLLGIWVSNVSGPFSSPVSFSYPPNPSPPCSLSHPTCSNC